MTKTRVAVIGAGRWGRNIIRTLGTIPSCVIAYIETRGFASLLSRKDIDAVVVATPPSTHAEVAIPFLEKGVPAFIEKPLALSMEDAAKIAAAAKRGGAAVFMGYVNLYNPAYQAMKHLTQSAGVMHCIVGEGMSNGPVRSDYSVLWDWAPHDLSMMLDIVGEMPEYVQAWGTSFLNPGTKLYDLSHLRLTFPSGLVGFALNSRVSLEKRRRLTVVGSSHSVIYDDTAAKKVICYEAGVVENAASYPSYEAGLPLTRELEAFIEMVRGNRESPNDLESGTRVVRILEAAEESIANGGATVML
jgi:predicted dehydrogenase